MSGILFLLWTPLPFYLSFKRIFHFSFSCSKMIISISIYSISHSPIGLGFSSHLFWRRKWESTPVFLPRECHEQRSLEGYSPWGHKELDTTEWLTLAHLFYFLQPYATISIISLEWILFPYPDSEQPAGWGCRGQSRGEGMTKLTHQ